MKFKALVAWDLHSLTRPRELGGFAHLLLTSWGPPCLVIGGYDYGSQTGGKNSSPSDLDTLRLTQLNDSNITLWFGFNLEAICKAQPSICLMSGPRHICHTKPDHRISFQKKKVFSKANFQSVFENYIPPRWKHTFSFCFRISTVNSWLSFQGGLRPFVSSVSDISPILYLLNRVWQEILREIIYLH